MAAVVARVSVNNKSLPSSVVLSATGDMIVELLSEDEEPVTTQCTVESRILQLASPVFRVMLGGNFKEGADLSRACKQNRELYKLALEDDNAKAMLTVLSIIHHNPRDVPKAISLPELVEIAVISEKYSTYLPLFPWIEMWLPAVKDLALRSRNEDYLMVAWAFRDKVLFEQLTRILILECKIAAGPDSDIVTKSSCGLHESIPSSVVGKLNCIYCEPKSQAANDEIAEISQRRNVTIDSLLAICSRYAKYYVPYGPPIRCKKAATDSNLCDTVMLGAVIKCLSSIELMPENHTQARRWSAETILDRLHNLRNTINGLVRDKFCSGSVVPSGHWWEDHTCKFHGTKEKCPGTVFHTECSFLPQMLVEVNKVIDDVKGLNLDDYDSRKV